MKKVKVKQTVEAKGVLAKLPPDTSKERLLEVRTQVLEKLKGAARVTTKELYATVKATVPEIDLALVHLGDEKLVKSEEVDKDTLLFLPLSEEESSTYAKLLKVAKGKEQFQAIMDIHDQRLYRQQYRSFNDFLECELGADHEWWETEKRRVRINDLLESKGIKLKVPLNKAVATELNKLRHEPEAFVAAVKDFLALPEKRQIAKKMGEIVTKSLQRLNVRQHIVGNVPDATDPELAALAPIANTPQRQWTDRIQEKIDAGLEPAKAILALSAETQAVPDAVTLLRFIRGEKELAPLVQELVRLHEGQKREEAKEAQRQADIRAAHAAGLRLHGEPEPPKKSEEEEEDKPKPPPVPPLDYEEDEGEEEEPEEGLVNLSITGKVTQIPLKTFNEILDEGGFLEVLLHRKDKLLVCSLEEVQVVYNG